MLRDRFSFRRLEIVLIALMSAFGFTRVESEEKLLELRFSS